ncbi:MAG: hypothetical protein IPN42_08150 [Methylococcaceae bacterium]|nr:hypothetical protein [Methylococcaceae bacterium]
MTYNSLKIISIIFLLQALPLSANTVAANQRPIATASEFTKDPFPLKNTRHYNESNDPAFKRCGTNSDGPQHGFFAVPLLVLGFAGILLYFSKSN